MFSLEIKSRLSWEPGGQGSVQRRQREHHRLEIVLEKNGRCS